MNRTHLTIFLFAALFMLSACGSQQENIGETSITKWQNGKDGAVSLTYDDGTINQFRKALPIMNELNFNATFFINTGKISGSQYHGKFIGRSVKQVIEETATIPTNQDNFFERYSAIRNLDLKGLSDAYKRAGGLFDAGNNEEAYKKLDTLYKKVRNDEFPPIRTNDGNDRNTVSWDDIRSYANQGHEFASHMITHPYLAALDEANILYELKKSREEILNQLGPKYTFSTEIPYGTENERALNYAEKFYPALRNWMPEPFLKEIHRGEGESPVSGEKEYVQWQRGALSDTPLPKMKSWIDTTAAQDNLWLVLVFHGVDGIGWEPLSSDLLRKYFRYIKSKEDDLWVATFGDVTKYIRERMNATHNTNREDGKITVTLKHSLDTTMYRVPLTLKTYLPSNWKNIQVKQGSDKKTLRPKEDKKGSYVLYQAVPNSEKIEITEL